MVEGWKSDKLLRDEYFKAFYPIEIGGHMWRAISWTTACSITSVVDMVAEGKLPTKGFVKQEEINLDDFLDNRFGQYFVD